MSIKTLQTIFKPKSEEEYKYFIDYLTPYELLNLGLNKKIEIFVISALDKGAVLQAYHLSDIIKNNFVNVIQKIKNKNVFLNNALEYCIEYNKPNIFKIALENGLKPIKKDLEYSIIENNLEIAKLIIKYGNIDPSYDNNILLSIAMYDNNKAIINFLSKYRKTTI